MMDGSDGLGRTLEIGTVKSVDVKAVWPFETGFSDWLSENIGILEDVTGLRLSRVGTEQSAGDFRVDIVGEGEDEGRVVIENQFGRSDHNHLGKLLTYLVETGAQCAIWIVEQPRPEHAGVVRWLNESVSVEADFFLLELKAIQIGESPPAPLLTMVEGPSMAARKLAGQRRSRSEREKARRRFFEGLLEYAAHRTGLHSNTSAQFSNRVGAAAAGFPRGSFWHYRILEHEAGIALNLEAPDPDVNRQVYGRLEHYRDAIEDAMGSPLLWDARDGVNRRRIEMRFGTGGWADEEKWPSVYDEMVRGMIKLEEVLREHYTHSEA